MKKHERIISRETAVFCKKVAALTSCLLLVFYLSACKQTINIGVNQFAPHPSLDNCYEGFVAGLAQEGYVDGNNVKIEMQNAQADMSKANSISSSFVSRKFDLICGIATPSAQTAFNMAQGTKTPVVFSAVSDPVAAGIVLSMDNPQNNVTGTADILPVEPQLKMIRAFLPEAKKIGILYTLSEVNSTVQIEEFEKLAPTYGFEIVTKGINETKDIQLACDVLLQDVDCITNLLDNTVVTSLPTIIEKANEKGIPVFGSEEEQLKSGCVGSEGIDYYALGIETGKMAARILKGESAAGIPVAVTESSTPFVNFDACAVLGIAVPEQYANAVNVSTEQ